MYHVTRRDEWGFSAMRIATEKLQQIVWHAFIKLISITKPFVQLNPPTLQATMFLSVIRPTARIAAVAPRILGSQIGSVRFFAISDELKKKVRSCDLRGISFSKSYNCTIVLLK
jgi:hypothetical protein